MAKAKKKAEVVRVFDFSMTDEYAGCCRALTVYGFKRGGHIQKKLTDKEWLAFIESRIGDGDVAFAHSSKENTGSFTPKKFAEWLKKNKQRVTSHKSGHMTYYVATITVKLAKKAYKTYRALAENEKETVREAYNH